MSREQAQASKNLLTELKRRYFFLISGSETHKGEKSPQSGPNEGTMDKCRSLKVCLSQRLQQVLTSHSFFPFFFPPYLF